MKRHDIRHKHFRRFGPNSQHTKPVRRDMLEQIPSESLCICIRINDIIQTNHVQYLEVDTNVQTFFEIRKCLGSVGF